MTYHGGYHIEKLSPDISKQYPSIGYLIEFLNRYGSNAYLVGGFIRDAILGRPASDIDIVVDGDSEAFAHALVRMTGGTLINLDPQRSKTRVMLSDRFRDCQPPLAQDLYPIQLDIESLNVDIYENLAGRDFSVDAMAVSLNDNVHELEIIDYFGGLNDLHSKTIRALYQDCFQNDPARLMRAVRLSVQYGFSIEENTIRMIKRDSNLLNGASPERTRDEFLKTLALEGSTTTLRTMDELGLLCTFIPELAAAREISQPKEHYWDVFNHCLETPGQIEYVTRQIHEPAAPLIRYAPWISVFSDHFNDAVSDGHTRRTITKLAGLLHDIAKPLSKTTDDTGRIRFLGHAVEGSEISENILRRMRMSTKGTKLISTMVRHHLRPSQIRQGNSPPTKRAMYRYFRDLGEASLATLYLNMADYLAAKGPMLDECEWIDYCKLIEQIVDYWAQSYNTQDMRQPLINGHVLMKNLNLAPGPEIGRLLRAVDEAHHDGTIATPNDALQLAKKLMV